MIKGFLTLSARPFHKGHESLIDFAKKNCDLLTILITNLPDDSIPYKYRLSWLLSTYLDDPKVNIIGLDIVEPDLSYDELSIWWGREIKKRVGEFDRVFTSEPYGDLFAMGLNAEHFLYDQKRSLYPISASQIREKPFTNWDHINSFAKDYFTKKIAIVGTESTGKTVLTEALANYFKTSWCPELGREIVSTSSETTRKDIEKIGVEHAKHINRHLRLSNKILFVDTDLTITQSYSTFLFGSAPKFDDWILKANDFDLYIYLNSNTPFIDDGTRFLEEDRYLLEEVHLKLFKDKNITLNRFDFDSYIPKNQAYAKRFYEVISLVNDFINKF